MYKPKELEVGSIVKLITMPKGITGKVYYVSISGAIVINCGKFRHVLSRNEVKKVGSG